MLRDPSGRPHPRRRAQSEGSPQEAFLNAQAKKGTSFVEIVSTCSSGWKMTPEKANQWMAENMFAHYPLGDVKDTTKAEATDAK